MQLPFVDYSSLSYLVNTETANLLKVLVYKKIKNAKEIFLKKISHELLKNSLTSTSKIDKVKRCYLRLHIKNILQTTP